MSKTEAELIQLRTENDALKAISLYTTFFLF